MRDFLNIEKAADHVVDPDKLYDISGSLQIVVKDIADKLLNHYPGWLWAVQPFEFGSIIKIFNLHVSGEFGYTMKVADIQDDPTRKLAIEAGGEILERYGLPRGPYDRELIRHRPRDVRGNLIPDITDKSSDEQKQERDRVITKAVQEGAIEVKAVDRRDEGGNVKREVFYRIGGDDNA